MSEALQYQVARARWKLEIPGHVALFLSQHTQCAWNAKESALHQAMAFTPGAGAIPIAGGFRTRRRLCHCGQKAIKRRHIHHHRHGSVSIRASHMGT